MEPKRAYKTILIGCSAVVLLVVFLAAGFLVGRYSNNIPIRIPGLSNSSTVNTSRSNETLFDPFWQSWQLVHEEYLNQPVDDEKMMQGAIRGMMDSLGDPHSGYMNPSEYGDATAPLEGYSGIGAYVNTEGEFLTITEPIKNSPAEAAGLKGGDQIIAIDGVDMTGVLPELARQKVLGQAGTQVVLTIKREGVDQPFEVTIIRAKINIPSVEYKSLDNNIAYLRLNAFSSTAGDEIKAALKELLVKNPSGLILDLRYNGGGYVDAAVAVASEFIPQGVVVTEDFGNGTHYSYDVTGDGIATKIPMVVLVNEWSASASEIVSGALHDYGRAQLVGVTTYGKGTVQNWIELDNKEGAIRVTIARWLTPKGTNVTGKGLTPDVEVKISDADAKAGIDTQLNKAVEVLTQP